MVVQTCGENDLGCKLANTTVMRELIDNGDMRIEIEQRGASQICVVYIGQVPVFGTATDFWPNQGLVNIGVKRFGERFNADPSSQWSNIPDLDSYFAGKTVLGRSVTWNNIRELDPDTIIAQDLDRSIVNRLMAFELVDRKINELTQSAIASGVNLADTNVKRAVQAGITNSIGYVHDILAHINAGDTINDQSEIMSNIHQALIDAYGALGETVPVDINTELGMSAIHMGLMVSAKNALHTILGSPDISTNTLHDLASNAVQSMSNLRSNADSLNTMVVNLTNRHALAQDEISSLQEEADRANAVADQYDALKDALTDSNISHDDLMSHITDLQQAIDADNSSAVVQSVAQHAQTLLQDLNQRVEEKSAALTKTENHNDGIRGAFVFLILLLVVVVALCVALGVKSAPPGRKRMP